MIQRKKKIFIYNEIKKPNYIIYFRINKEIASKKKRSLKKIANNFSKNEIENKKY